MKAPPFRYARPRDLPEAVRMLAGEPGAKLLAGGQSLAPMLNLRLTRPAVLVDIGRLGELRGIADEGAALRIGAGVTHARIEDADGALAGAPMLREVAAGIAYRAVRNRGTIGGSLAHADPAGDWPLALAVLGAELVASGPRGERRLAAESFMAAAFTTALAEDEILTGVILPKPSPAARWGYVKFCRKTGEFPEASAAALFDPERRIARVAVGALPGAPQPLPDLARAVAEEGPGAARREPILAALAAASPGLDTVARRMHAAVVGRAIARAFA